MEVAQYLGISMLLLILLKSDARSVLYEGSGKDGGDDSDDSRGGAILDGGSRGLHRSGGVNRHGGKVIYSCGSGRFGFVPFFVPGICGPLCKNFNGGSGSGNGTEADGSLDVWTTFCSLCCCKQL